MIEIKKENEILPALKNPVYQSRTTYLLLIGTIEELKSRRSYDYLSQLAVPFNRTTEKLKLCLGVMIIEMRLQQRCANVFQ